MRDLLGDARDIRRKADAMSPYSRERDSLLREADRLERQFQAASDERLFGGARFETIHTVDRFGRSGEVRRRIR